MPYSHWHSSALALWDAGNRLPSLSRHPLFVDVNARGFSFLSASRFRPRKIRFEDISRPQNETTRTEFCETYQIQQDAAPISIQMRPLLTRIPLTVTISVTNTAFQFYCLENWSYVFPLPVISTALTHRQSPCTRTLGTTSNIINRFAEHKTRTYSFKNGWISSQALPILNHRFLCFLPLHSMRCQHAWADRPTSSVLKASPDPSTHISGHVLAQESATSPHPIISVNHSLSTAEKVPINSTKHTNPFLSYSFSNVFRFFSQPPLKRKTRQSPTCNKLFSQTTLITTSSTVSSSMPVTTRTWCSATKRKSWWKMDVRIELCKSTLKLSKTLQSTKSETL